VGSVPEQGVLDVQVSGHFMDAGHADLVIRQRPAAKNGAGVERLADGSGGRRARGAGDQVRDNPAEDDDRETYHGVVNAALGRLGGASLHRMSRARRTSRSSPRPVSCSW
jgi:hypothetical protein